ncbi:hypothetical protein pb186bvf_005827 [Paramecium bursaria]
MFRKYHILIYSKMCIWNFKEFYKQIKTFRFICFQDFAQNIVISKNQVFLRKIRYQSQEKSSIYGIFTKDQSSVVVKITDINLMKIPQFKIFKFQYQYL